ncbi:MAG: MFS transporter [Tepidisphaeraceae bacterium]
MNLLFERLLLSLDELTAAQRRAALRYVTVAWIFGNFWWMCAFPGTVTVTRLFQELGAGDLAFGFVAALPHIAALFSLPASMWVDRTGERKQLFLRFQYLQRFLWFVVALLPLWTLRGDPPPVVRAMSLYAILAIMMVQWLANAVGSPAWVGWMADLVPDRIRGRYFARRRQWGLVSGIIAAILTGVVLQHLAPRTPSTGIMPVDYNGVFWVSMILCAAAFAGVMDIHLFRYVPHVPPIRKDKPPLLATVKAALTNRPFMIASCYLGLLHLSIAPLGQFGFLYFDEVLRMTDVQKQLALQVGPMLAQLSVLFLWGRLVDRIGKKPLLTVASLGLLPVGAGWCLMIFGYTWLGYVVAIAQAALWAAIEVANLNLVMEASTSNSDTNGSSAKKPATGVGFWAINVLIFASTGVVGTIASGWFMRTFKGVSVTLPLLPTPRPFGAYEILFAILVVVRVAAIITLLPKIHEPTATPTRKAVKLIAAEMYAGMLRGVALPRRMLPLAGGRLRRSRRVRRGRPVP